MKLSKLQLFLIISIVSVASIVIATRWSDYGDQTAGNVADTDTFLIRDVDDTSLAATGTQKEYPWSVLKADLTTWMNGTDFSSITGDRETSGMVGGGIRQYKDGSADGDISALNDTTSAGTDGDPIELTAKEMMGTTITNLGATGALYFLLPTAAIGFHTVFNVDVAQDIHLKFPAANDEGYWKDYDDTGFALQATGKDIQCNSSIAVGDRVILQTRKVGSTIEYFVWSDCDACIIEP